MRKKLPVASYRLPAHMPLRGLFLIYFIIASLLVTSNWQLVTPAYADIYSRNAADLERIQDYLNGITTVTADFTQVAPDGSLTGGKFFLKRPGKMRWQYSPPTPLLMIADGTAKVSTSPAQG